MHHGTQNMGQQSWNSYMAWRLRCPLSHLCTSFISCACSVVPVLHQSLSQSFHTPFNSSSLCIFLNALFPNSHLCYKSEHSVTVIAGLWDVLEPVPYERQHCVDANESQSACWIQLGDRLISFPLFSIREQETKLEKPTPAVLSVPKRFSLKSELTAENLSSIFRLCSLVYWMRVLV